MKTWFRQLDAVLRGDATKLSAIRDGSIAIPVGGLTVVSVLLAAAAGACMGSYAVVRLGVDGLMQLVASAVKLPLLFALTLAVTFPSLYVFNALVGSRLRWESVLRLLVAANAVMLAVFASLGPIVIFFGLSTTSYPFMKLLNVTAAAVGGLLGLAFLLRTLHRLVLVQEANDALEAERAREADLVTAQGTDEDEAPDAPAQTDPPADVTTDPGTAETPPAAEPAAPDQADPDAADTPTAGEPTRVQQYLHRHGAPGVPGQPTTGEEKLTALDRYTPVTPGKARSVFRVWVLVYAIVGAQMGWVLRPFIGAPGMEFTWFREKQSNFFMDVLESLGKLFGA